MAKSPSVSLFVCEFLIQRVAHATKNESGHFPHTSGWELAGPDWVINHTK